MSLRERLAADEVTITAWSGVPDALTVELLAGQPFNAVTLDMQHGGHHEDSVLRSILPVQKAGKPVLVRIPVGRFDMASRALDFGADAVIAPMINSLDDARRFAASMKYPPIGERSWGPTFGAPRYGRIDQQEWLKKSNDRVLAFAMIETRAAFDALDDILSVPGIDGIFVGPSDFSIAWSNGEVVDSTLEEMLGTVAAIAERTREAGKYAAIYVMEPKIAGRIVRMGFRLLASGSEGQLFSLGTSALLGAINQSIKG